MAAKLVHCQLFEPDILKYYNNNNNLYESIWIWSLASRFSTSNPIRFVNRYLLHKISLFIYICIDIFYSFLLLWLLFYVIDLVYWILFTQQPFPSNQKFSFLHDFHSRNFLDCLYLFIFAWTMHYTVHGDGDTKPNRQQCSTYWSLKKEIENERKKS